MVVKKYIGVLLFLLLISFLSSAQEKFEMNFECCFLSDTVSFYVNDQAILENIVLKNDFERDNGHTGLFIIFEEKNEPNLFGVISSVIKDEILSENLYIKDIQKLKFKVVIGQQVFQEYYNLNKGIYFGLGTINENYEEGIFIQQELQPIQYD